MTPRAAPRGVTHTAPASVWAWQEQAACAGMPLWLFFGHDGEDPLHADLREARAKEVCQECPLATWRACLETALQARPIDQHGVQAGYTADERRNIRAARVRKATKHRRAA